MDLAQDVMLPASHAHSSYSVGLSVPSKRSGMVALAPATQHSQQQKASQLAGDLTKSPTVRIPEGGEVLIRC